MLVIFGGLPGTGKSTIARQVADKIGASYLRIDSIEQAIRSSGALPPGSDVGPAGYMAAQRIAADNLRLGRSVVVDSVNPLTITRDAYRDVAVRSDAPFIEIELVCSDPALHRHRLESRACDIEGLVPPTWDQVVTRPYDPWHRPCLQLDTARLPAGRCVELILQAVSAHGLRRPAPAASDA
ncbi:AAA family ATPase [Azospirillum picis]|uniref:Kinase n=1 Tax=Azospirillum picis TaxID=488438 RepID=A0ABU0MMI1_9PROT|nr:AAA family ATPase [Azospirillum picis]MBP2300702.1 putative kinase [Azospirillum picis]MDQ0534671.1 putative kinase [Azospirillum picis]